MDQNSQDNSTVRIGNELIKRRTAYCRGKQVNTGFTLLELLLVIAIVGIIATLMVYTFVGLGSLQVLEQETAAVRGLIEEARSYTQSSREASSYGVRFEEKKVILFKGENWAERDEVLQEHRFDDSVTISSIDLDDEGSEIVFQRLFGELHTSGQVELWSASEEEGRQVKIYPSGLVE